MSKSEVCLFFLLTSASVASLAQAPAPRHPDCAALDKVALPDGKITLAEQVAAGAFALPEKDPDRTPSALFKEAPAFCRVAAQLTPSTDSDIQVEVWMPVAGWNGKFRGQGNGGFAGSLNYEGMAAAVAQGYATASTDTGHSGGDAKWALGHPEKVVDFGYRAIHEMTTTAKTIVQSYYGSGPKWAYFAACSNGGRQGLMEAQRFPADYNGILAGAPAYNWTHLTTGGLSLLKETEGPRYIPGSKIASISRAVDAACDAKDGVKDGVLNDPRTCHFDPSTLLCKQGDGENCLTAPQAAALKGIYSGAKGASGREITPGFMPGAEEGGNGWATWITGTEKRESLARFFATSYFSNMVYARPNWDYKSANVESALKMADAKTGRMLNATDPDLKPFMARGGKLILYHGWNDPAIPALMTVEYYNRLAAEVGQDKAGSSVRLYMVPGMQHCDGGPGADSFGQGDQSARSAPEHDIYAALEQWVEEGTAPSTIVATKYEDRDRDPVVKMARPLCVYPQVARYNGEGNTSEASSFNCGPPP